MPYRVDGERAHAVGLGQVVHGDGGHDALRKAEAGSTAATRRSGASAPMAPMTSAATVTRITLPGSMAMVIAGLTRPMTAPSPMAAMVATATATATLQAAWASTTPAS